MTETLTILLDIPPMDAIKFAVTMALTVAFSYFIVCGTSRRKP